MIAFFFEYFDILSIQLLTINILHINIFFIPNVKNYQPKNHFFPIFT